MARAPDRNRRVYFLGAGFSRSVGLPSTQELLVAARDFMDGNELEAAYKHFYPLERAKGFRPNVVDFFSLLQSHIAVARSDGGGALPGDPFLQAPQVYSSLKWAIVRCLIERTRAANLSNPLPGLDRLLRNGNIIITSNWDLIIESYAREQSRVLSYRLERPDSAIVVLKLHGSIDWTRRDATKKQPGSDFASLRERSGPGTKRLQLPTSETVLRVKALENPTRAWHSSRMRACRTH